MLGNTPSGQLLSPQFVKEFAWDANQDLGTVLELSVMYPIESVSFPINKAGEDIIEEILLVV